MCVLVGRISELLPTFRARNTTFFFVWTSILTKCNLAILNCVSIHQIRSHELFVVVISFCHMLPSTAFSHTILSRWSNHNAFPSFTVADLIFMMIWYYTYYTCVLFLMNELSLMCTKFDADLVYNVLYTRWWYHPALLLVVVLVLLGMRRAYRAMQGSIFRPIC